MTNAYYNHTTAPATGSAGSSAVIRAEFDAVTAGFNLLPTLTGNLGKFVIVNALGTAMDVSSTIADLSGTITITGNLSVSGVVTHALGAVNLPSITFIGDPDTGIWSPGANQVAVSTNGALKLTVDANGNMTPGTSNSQTLGSASLRWSTVNSVLGNFSGVLTAAGVAVGGALTAATTGSFSGSVNVGGLLSGTGVAVNGALTAATTGSFSGAVSVGSLVANGTITGVTDFTNTGNTVLGDVATDTLNVGANGIIKDANGNTGFNVSPTNFAGYTTVEAKGKSGGAGGLFKTTSSTATVSGEFYALDASGVGIGSATAHALLFNIASVEKMRIDTSGNVGIGAVPTFQLDLQRTGSPVLRVLSVGNAGAYVQANSNVDVRFGSTTNHPLLFQVNSNEVARLDTSGNFGIGAASPAARLYATSTAALIAHLNTSFATGGYLQLSQSNTVFAYVGNAGVLTAGGTLNDLAIRSDAGISFAGSAGTERMKIDSSGNLLVGTSTATFTGANRGLIEINGSAQALLGFKTGGVDSGYLYHSGTDFFLTNSKNSSIIFSTNTTEKLRITADGRLYGTALHNNAGSVTGTTTQYIASGTYTPTYTAGANISSVAAGTKATWIRVGNVVTVCGQATPTFTTAGVIITNFDISLPIASNLAATTDLSGLSTTVFTTDGVASLSANVVNDRATWTRGDISANGAHTYTWSFQYEVL